MNVANMFPHLQAPTEELNSERF